MICDVRHLLYAATAKMLEAAAAAPAAAAATTKILVCIADLYRDLSSHVVCCHF